MRIQMLFENDSSFRKRAGFIGAQHIHRAKILNRVQSFDDNFLARHREGALRKIYGHDHRQHFRSQANGHGHGKQERFKPVVFTQPVDQKDHWNHHGDETDHQPGELIDPFIETGRRLASPGRNAEQLPKRP